MDRELLQLAIAKIQNLEQENASLKSQSTTTPSPATVHPSRAATPCHTPAPSIAPPTPAASEGGDGRTNGMEVDEAKGKETKTTDDTIITPDGKAVTLLENGSSPKTPLNITIKVPNLIWVVPIFLIAFGIAKFQHCI